MPKYVNRVPDGMQAKVIADLRIYKAREKISDWALAKKVGSTTSSVQKWISGKSKLTSITITRLVEAGITSVKLPEQVRQEAINRIIQQKDERNAIPRYHRRLVQVPEIIGNQMKNLLGEYIKSLNDSLTWTEHTEKLDTLIQKLYYLSKQGE